MVLCVVGTYIDEGGVDVVRAWGGAMPQSHATQFI